MFIYLWKILALNAEAKELAKETSYVHFNHILTRHKSLKFH